MDKIHKKQKEKPSKPGIKKPLLRPEWQLAIFILALGLIYGVLFHTVYTTQYSAVGSIFFDYASLIMQGDVPYLDFTLEYPPLALLFFVLPRLASSFVSDYIILFKAEVLLAILIGLVITYLISCRMGKAPWKMMLVYTMCILAVGPIIAEQFDIFPAVLTLGSLYAFLSGKNKTAWALLALGALTKIYPLFLAPVYLAIAWRNRQYRSATAGILTALLIGAVFILPFVFLGLESLKSLAEYHMQRGIQLESTYSSFLLIADRLGLTQINPVFNYGSWNLIGGPTETLTKLSSYFIVILLVLVYGFIFRSIKPGKSQSTRLGTYALLVLSIVLITSKVLSPQYLIWLVPIIPLVLQRGRNIILAFFVLIGALSYYLFPHVYMELTRLEIVPVTILFFRNLFLIALTVLTVAYLRQMKASE